LNAAEDKLLQFLAEIAPPLLGPAQVFLFQSFLQDGQTFLLEPRQLLVQLRNELAEMSLQQVLIFLAVLADGFHLLLELRNFPSQLRQRQLDRLLLQLKGNGFIGDQLEQVVDNGPQEHLTLFINQEILEPPLESGQQARLKQTAIPLPFPIQSHSGR